MPVALILIDALSASYLTPDILPAVYEVGRGAFAGPIENIYAYRGIEATLFTGLFPDEHGVWGEFRPSRRWLSESGAEGGGQNEVKPAMDLLAHNAISLG